MKCHEWRIRKWKHISFVPPRFSQLSSWIANFASPRALTLDRDMPLRTQPSVIYAECELTRAAGIYPQECSKSFLLPLWAAQKYYKAINSAYEEAKMLFVSLHRIAQFIVPQLTFHPFARLARAKIRLEDSHSFRTFHVSLVNCFFLFARFPISIQNASTFSTSAFHGRLSLTRFCYFLASATFRSNFTKQTSASWWNGKKL